MKFLVCVFCVYTLLNVIKADCKPDTQKSTESRLKETLLCGYDKTERPFSDQNNQTHVFVVFFPRYFDFDDSKDFIQLSTFIFMMWKDYNLQWTTSDYNGIKDIPVNAKDIWVPDFRVLNSKLVNANFDNQGVSLSIVKFNGGVQYIMTTLLGVHCSAVWTDWPFDKHICNFTVTSETYMGNEMDVFSGNIGVSMIKFVPSHEWELLKYESLRDELYSGEKNDSEAEYEVFNTVRFTIQRHSAVLAASYISPAIAIMVFSIGLLFVEPKNSDRLTIISLMLVLQSLYLQYLAYKIPSNGDRNPKIVTFFVSCLFITGVLFIETLVLVLMSSWTMKFAWVDTVSNAIGSNSILKVIFLSGNDYKKFVDTADPGNEEGPFLSSEDNVEKQWKMVAGIVNRLTILLLLIFYVAITIFVIVS